MLLAALAACAVSPETPAEPSAPLRDLGARLGIHVGAAVSYEAFRVDERYRRVLAREFSALTPENWMKWERVHPAPEQWNFTPADELVAFAEAHGMAVRGHTLVWHNQLPGWVAALSDPAELREAVERHIHTLVSRYRGRVESWDVVNEAMAEDGSGLRDTLFRRALGDDYIAEVFRIAHEADPQARLFYNDYLIAAVDPKSDQVYRLVQGLIEDGVPIHGIGMQMHVTAKDPPALDSFAANVERFVELGLLVDITEMDVRIAQLEIAGEAALRRQAEVYSDLIATRLPLPNLRSITFWGFTDAHSWIDLYFEEDDPLLFDEQYRPKPAYLAVQGALLRARPRRDSR